MTRLNEGIEATSCLQPGFDASDPLAARLAAAWERELFGEDHADLQTNCISSKDNSRWTILGYDSGGIEVADFVYTTVPGKIKQLLNKVRQVGVPTKVNTVWLKTIGFTSSNDKTLVGVLKFIDLIDSSGTPTPRWSQFRGNSYKKVLGEAIRVGYSELFAVYPDANARPQSEIEHVFRTSSSAGNQAIAKTVATFKALVEEAEFVNDNNGAELTMAAAPLHVPVAETNPARSNEMRGLPGASLHIDIQIHISPESSAEQIDQIFASMSKHLYGSKK